MKELPLPPRPFANLPSVLAAGCAILRTPNRGRQTAVKGLP